SGLNTRPARTPTNASQPASRLATHSSGPTWFAIPLSYDSCIRYTSPLIPALPPLPPIALGAHLFCLRDRRGNSLPSAPPLWLRPACSRQTFEVSSRQARTRRQARPLAR